jgi:hypothetical protein
MKTESDCPCCGNLQPTGVTKTRPIDKIKDPFRVYLSGDPDGVFVDAKNLDFARATACGHDGAIIHTLEEATP